MKRRGLLASLAALLATGCGDAARKGPLSRLLAGTEDLNRAFHDATGRRSSLAREYAPHDLSPFFRGNGSLAVDSDEYRAHVADGFARWGLTVSGLVERPLALSLGQLRALPQRTQITRHDCVEGWSAIGQWTGPQLSRVLRLARVKPEARYIVFHCADKLGGVPYYESVDMVDAFHPQTILAHALNGQPLPVANGAPLRVRIERQLGYKHAKFLTGLSAVASLEGIGAGKGGYWEDREGYQWYAGI